MLYLFRAPFANSWTRVKLKQGKRVESVCFLFCLFHLDFFSLFVVVHIKIVMWKASKKMKFHSRNEYIFFLKNLYFQVFQVVYVFHCSLFRMVKALKSLFLKRRIRFYFFSILPYRCFHINSVWRSFTVTCFELKCKVAHLCLKEGKKPFSTAPIHYSNLYGMEECYDKSLWVYI